MSAGKLPVTKRKGSLLTRSVIAATAIAFATLGLGAASASAQEPIVGLWEITSSYQGTVQDYLCSGWTSDGLEFDEDISPVLVNPICYGHWIKLKDRTYAMTHPYFDMSPSTGLWEGTSGYFNLIATVSKDGKTFTAISNLTDGVPGANPCVGKGTFSTEYTATAVKIEVDKSLLP
jgi:hypothetical protein